MARNKKKKSSQRTTTPKNSKKNGPMFVTYTLGLKMFPWEGKSTVTHKL